MTDHIGDAAQMVPLSQQRLDEIRARAEKARKGRLGWQGAAANYRTDITTLLAEVERLHEKQRWIPVEERLPECDARWGCSKIVWCCDAHGRSGFGIYQNGTSQLRHASWFTGGGVAEESVMVTHWMPLPDPIGRKEG